MNEHLVSKPINLCVVKLSNSWAKAGSLRLPIVMILALIVSACMAKQDPVATAEPAAAAAPEYDMNSWKTIIGDECRSFNDGCNNCFREPGKMAACTRKACLTYQQPRCLDEEAAAESAAAARLSSNHFVGNALAVTAC